MKKVSRKIFGLLAASALFAGAFVSCSNGSDSPFVPANPSGTTQNGGTPLSDSATIKDVAAVATSGITAAKEGNTATLSASNGTYVLTGTAAQSNIAISALQGQSIGGTWKFTETGKTSPKYIGSYTGDISAIGNANTNLTLKVEKVLNNGLLTAVVEKKDISMTVPTSGTFDATIPAVKVSSVTSYLASRLYASYDTDQHYEISSQFDRLNVSGDKIDLTQIGALKKLQDGKNTDKDNVSDFASGPCTIANGQFTGTLYGKTKTFKIDADGDLVDDKGDKNYILTSGSYMVYINATVTLDGANSVAKQKGVMLNDDEGKTGQVMDSQRTVNASKTINLKDITYSIDGNTVTLKFSDNTTKTATLSADRKTLTLDGVVYTKL